MNISFFLKPKVEVSYLTESCPVQKAIMKFAEFLL